MVLDDLSSGHRGFVPDDVAFVEGSILDTGLVARSPSTRSRASCTSPVQVREVSVQRPLHT